MKKNKNKNIALATQAQINSLLKEYLSDLKHEIIHVKQHERYPLIYPFLYLFELLKNGYRQNRFEVEAYTLSKSVYKEETTPLAKIS